MADTATSRTKGPDSAVAETKGDPIVLVRPTLINGVKHPAGAQVGEDRDGQLVGTSQGVTRGILEARLRFKIARRQSEIDQDAAARENPSKQDAEPGAENGKQSTGKAKTAK